MKIFFVPSWYATEDAPLRGIFFAAQARALTAAGHEVRILYPDLRVRMRGLAHGVLPLPGGVPGLLLRERAVLPFCAPALRLQRGRMLERLYAQASDRWGVPDAVHLHSCLMGEETVALCRRHRLPLVYTEHYSGVLRTMDAPLMRALRATLAGAAQALAVSRALCAPMQALRADVRCVPNLVDTDVFCPTPAPHEGLVFGILCSLVPVKRVDMLLRAFAQAKLPDARLRVGGDGPERARLERLARALGLAGRVEFTGAVPARDAPAFYNSCDVLVCASSVETFGVTLIEALACGVPVLATRCGGPEDIVVPGRNGWLVEPDDVQALAEGLHGMAERVFDPVALRADCKARFGARAVVAQLEQAYRRAAAENAYP